MRGIGRLTIKASFCALVLLGLALNGASVAAAPGDWWGEYFDNPYLGGSPVLSPLPVSGLLAWRGSFTLDPHGVPGTFGSGLNNDKEA